MTDDVDLDAYFERIGWEGEARPTYASLAGILEAHVNSVPFENFDVLLGRTPRLDVTGLQDKLVRAKRGGYCFEHATLFGAVLEAVGFAVERCAARVVLFQPASISPRAHMLLVVSAEGARYVVDPGFGMFGTKAPAPLDEAGRSPSKPTHRLSKSDGLLTAWVVREGAEVPGWVSTATPENPIDFEVANHFTATHPQSPFVNTLMASATKGGRRVNLMNAEATFVGPEGVEKRALPDRRALRELVAEFFGFDLPEIETVRVPAAPDWR